MQIKRIPLAISILSALVVLNGSLAGCSMDKSAEGLIAEAKAYRQKGDISAAIIQLRNALNKSPNDANARYLLGVLYNESGVPDSAEKEFRKALGLGIEPATVAPDLGASLFALGQYQKLVDDTGQVVAANKADARLLVLRGDAFLELDLPEKAEESFNGALAKNAGSAGALIGLARYALTRKDMDGAMRLAEQAIVAEPKELRAWYLKGELLREKGDLEGARGAFNAILKLRPGEARAHIALAGLEITAGKLDAARASIEAARKTDPRGLQVVYTQAWLNYAEGQPTAALEKLQDILAVAPEHVPSLLLAGTVQHALGADKQAEQYLKRALLKRPGDAHASSLLVSILLADGATNRAMAALGRALANAPKDPQVLALAGETYMRMKDYQKATEYFQEASKLAPDKPFVRTSLAMSRLAQGDEARAIVDLEASTDLDPNGTRAAVMLVMAHVRNKEVDKALAVANKLEKSQPENPLVQNLKGAVYVAKKDFAAARTSFQKALTLQPTYLPAVSSLVQLDLLEKKPDAAKKRLESFLQVDKKNVEAMTALAELARNQGRADEAITWMERASNIKPDDKRLSLSLAATYLQGGEKLKALNLVRKLHDADPSNPDALDLLAQAKVANDDKMGALESYEMLTSVTPVPASVHVRMAKLQIRLMNESAAIASLNKALALSPANTEAQLGLASIEAGKGNYPRALTVARQMQKQATNRAAGFELEGDILMTQKKPEQAIKAYETSIAKSQNGLVMVKLHQAFREAGQEKEGTSRLVEWVKQNPNDVAARVSLGTAYLNNQQYKAAIEQFEGVLERDANNVAALNNLASALQAQKDNHALAYAERAHALAADNPAILDTLGWILAEKGDTARALPILQKAVSLAPGDPDIRFHLAATFGKSGDAASARKELAQVFSQSKAFPSLEDAKLLQKKLQ
jgi:putative PEP-CTERM system TPR-repeat lipoprotein